MSEIVRLVPIADPEVLQEAVNAIPNQHGVPILAELPTFTDYVQAIYGDDAQQRVMAKSINRPAQGIGPHWDIHSPFVDPEFPFVATFNVRGAATLRAATLDTVLHQHYQDRFPEATAESRAARRHYGQLALNIAAVTYEADIRKGTGLIIPQLQTADALPLVHDISPVIPRWMSRGVPTSGKFIKLVVPGDSDEATDVHRKEGFIPLSDFLAREAAERQRAQEDRDEWAQVEEESLARARGLRFVGKHDSDTLYD